MAAGLGGDSRRYSRCRAELLGIFQVSVLHNDLKADQMREVAKHPARMTYAVTAFASATSSAFVSRRRMLAAIDRVAVPVLLSLALLGCSREGELTQLGIITSRSACPPASTRSKVTV